MTSAGTQKHSKKRDTYENGMCFLSFVLPVRLQELIQTKQVAPVFRKEASWMLYVCANAEPYSATDRSAQSFSCPILCKAGLQFNSIGLKLPQEMNK